MEKMDDSTMVIILSCVIYEALLIWLWVIRYLYKQSCGGSRVPTFIIFLLLSDLPDLGLTPFVYQKILSGPQVAQQPDTWSLSALFFGTRLYALYLHQLVTLESILYLRQPLFSAQIFTPTKAFIICLSVWVSVVFLSHLCATVPVYVRFSIYVLLCLVPLVMAIVTCVLALANCPISSQDSSTGQGRRAALLVTTWSVVTFVLVYVPLLVVMCLAHYPSFLSDGHPFYSVPEMAWVQTTCVNGVRVMADPLLCVLVCSQIKKLNRSVTTEGDAQEIQTNLDMLVLSQVKGQRSATTEKDVRVEVLANLGSDLYGNATGAGSS